MSTQVQYRRGTESQNNAFTGALAEITVDTTNWTLRIHDGLTAGGFALVTATSPATFTNKIYQGTSLSVSGNVTGGNINTGGLISATGNITGGNISATNYIGTTVSVTGNITGGNINGGANVNATTHTGATVSVTGNVTGGNLVTGGIVSAVGNITGGNVSAVAYTGSTASLTGNITGGNISTAGLISSTGNVTGGNINTAGQVSATGNVTGGGITLSGNTIFSTGSTLTIDPSTTGVGGTVIIAGNLNVTGTTTTYDSTTVTINDLLFTVANNASTAASANGGGIEVGPAGASYASWTYDQANGRWSTALGIGATGNITGGNINTAGLISATGNITGGNVSATNYTGTTVSVTGNITGGGLVGTLYTNSVINTGANATGNIGSATTYFNTVFAKATSAQYADLAEKYTADADYEPGTVVVFGGPAEVTASNKDADKCVVGVVSTNPSYIMNAGLESQHVVTIALIGRVPTKVVGPVQRGDFLVSAPNGHAQACATPAIGTVIGKAIEDFTGESGVIEILVNNH